MDDPMEEILPDSTTERGDSHDMQQRKATGPPLLRPGSTMVMMAISVEDYETQYWPKLEDAINQLLTMVPGQYLPISYEQMYSCVYKCVCKQFSERLYSDLIQHLKSHLKQTNVELQNCMQEEKPFIEKFAYIMRQYLQALSGIVPIFNYMSRFYVVPKLKTNLKLELMKLFQEQIADQRVCILLPLLEDAISKPFMISPPLMSGLVKNLFEINPEYAKANPALFGRYLPNVQPQTSIDELDRYIEETRLMQQEMHRNPEFFSCDQTRKRASDEDVVPECLPQLLNFPSSASS